MPMSKVGKIGGLQRTQVPTPIAFRSTVIVWLFGIVTCILSVCLPTSLSNTVTSRLTVCLGIKSPVIGDTFHADEFLIFRLRFLVKHENMCNTYNIRDIKKAYNRRCKLSWNRRVIYKLQNQCFFLQKFDASPIETPRLDWYNRTLTVASQDTAVCGFLLSKCQHAIF